MSKAFNDQVQAFIDRAPELELWAYERLANREDVVYRYHATDRRDRGTMGCLSPNAFLDPRTVGRNETDPEKQLPDTKYALNHFAGGTSWKRCNIVALPTTSPDSTCKWLCVDIDQHGDLTPEVAEKNLAGALEISARLAAKGIRAIIEDSNGAGGYHVWALFEQPVGARDLHEFGKELVRGLDVEKVEYFPKQGTLRAKHYGNPVRLPGLHHTRDHVSRFWDGQTWLEGPAAVEYLLAAPTNDPALIPVLPPAPPRVKKPRSNTPTDLSDLKGALEALPEEYATVYDQWTLVMLALAREANNAADADTAELLYELAAEFSSRWDQYDDEKFEHQDWPAFLASTEIPADDPSGEITVASVFKWAKENGWQRPLRREIRMLARRGRMMAGAELGKDNGQTDSAAVDTAKISIVPDDSTVTPTAQPAAQTDEPKQTVLKLPEDRDLIGFTRDEIGNSQRFAYLFGQYLRWVPEWNTWMSWNGRVWAEDSTQERKRCAFLLLDLMASEVDRITDDNPETQEKKRTEWLKFVRSSRNRTAISNMLDLAQSLMIGSTSDYDRTDPHLLNVGNGVVDLRTGKLLPHDIRYMFTTISDVDYDPAARSPGWTLFLAAVFEKHPDLIPFMRRLAGYLATGLTIEQLVFIFFGDGSNGKSKLIEILRAVFGSGIVGTASAELFLKSEHGQSKERHIAGLFGKRWAYSEELNDGDVLDEATVKGVSGCAVLKGRRLYKEAFEFQMMAKLIMVTNHLPRIPGGGHSVYRRLVVMPFDTLFWDPEEFDDDDKDEQKRPEHLRINKNIVKDLMAEASGILTWIVQGAVEYFANGLQVPETARLATQQYRMQEETLERFASECCEVGSCTSDDEAVRSGMYSTYEALYEAYKVWAVREGFQHLLGLPKFRKDIVKVGHTVKAGRGYIQGERPRIVRNLRLKPEAKPGDIAVFRAHDRLSEHLNRVEQQKVLKRAQDHLASGPDHFEIGTSGQGKPLPNNDLAPLDHLDHFSPRVLKDKVKGSKEGYTGSTPSTTSTENQILSGTGGPSGPVDASPLSANGFAGPDPVSGVVSGPPASGPYEDSYHLCNGRSCSECLELLSRIGGILVEQMPQPHIGRLFNVLECGQYIDAEFGLPTAGLALDIYPFTGQAEIDTHLTDLCRFSSVKPDQRQRWVESFVDLIHVLCEHSATLTLDTLHQLQDLLPGYFTSHLDVAHSRYGYPQPYMG